MYQEMGDKNDHQHGWTDRYRPVLHRMALEPLFGRVCAVTQSFISAQGDTL